MPTSPQKPVTLINILSVDPSNQPALVALLRETTEAVIPTLKGWISTSLMAGPDGTHVVISSQWESTTDVDAMRADPRMVAAFPKIGALATLTSIAGETVMSRHR